MSKKIPSQKHLREALKYCPETGGLVWRQRPQGHFASSSYAARWNKRFAGKAAFATKTTHGFQGFIDGRLLLTHRVVWKLVYGEQPKVIDHINGDARDNRLDNLRNVDQATNQKNMKRSSANTSGETGVSRFRDGYRARIKVNGIERHLGTFATIEAAAQARKAANMRYGFHENHGQR